MADCSSDRRRDATALDGPSANEVAHCTDQQTATTAHAAVEPFDVDRRASVTVANAISTNAIAVPIDTAAAAPCPASSDRATAPRCGGGDNHELLPLPTAESSSPSDAPRFEPLRARWRYGQAVFARYRKTPYFYSGNIATYLGAGLFMVVFDDGTLNYRVKREDIVLRSTKAHTTDVSEDDDSCSYSYSRSGNDSCSGSGASLAKSTAHSSRTLTHSSRTLTHSNSSTVHQNHTMVDFSTNPPTQFAIRDDDGDADGDGDDRGDSFAAADVLAMKRLECGVAYEDDSTQVSDSDDSMDDEDANITPWQQMTQTFGIASKARPRASRRSSVSSLSQVDRLSMTQMGLPIALPMTPKGLKQTLQDYLVRKTTKKVHPTGVNGSSGNGGAPVGSSERVQLMATRARELAAKFEAEPTFSTHVVYTTAVDGVRSYGTIKTRLANGDLEVITADDQMIAVQRFAPERIDVLPSVRELELQIADLARASKPLYAGRKVQVNLYPGSRFSGHGVVTLEVKSNATFNVLLQNRIRLLHVPADKLVPLAEKKRGDVVRITDDQFLVCAGKTKVYIGDQVLVKCEDGDYDGVVEEKIGILNGVFSNRTAAVDFADGSTGYELSPARITKRKRPSVSADLDVLSLKNAVLMQASGSIASELLEVGFHVKADHPRKASVETCVVLTKHASSACDVRFSDGTIAFEVFPSQMIFDSGASSVSTSDAAGQQRALREAFVGDYVLAWSSRFGRYCSAKIAAKTADGGLASLYAVVFDYGEAKANVPLDKIAPIDRVDALAPTQKLTNYSIDTIGFEIQPIAFAVGEAVAARVYGSVQYYRGWVEAVREKERQCVVQFDSSERDEHVPFSAMFSVDARNRYQSIGNRLGSSSGGADRLSHMPDESAVGVPTIAPDDMNSLPMNRRRRHSGGSVGSIIMSVAGTLFRSKKDGERFERRGSHLVTEMGAVLRRVPDP